MPPDATPPQTPPQWPLALDRHRGAEPLTLWDLVIRVFREIGDDRVLLIAAGVTYYVLLALVPSLAVFVSVYGLFTDPAEVNRHVNLLVGIVPPGGVDLIRQQLSRLTSASSSQLSATLIVSLLVALWSAGAGVRALIDAMNVAYDVTEKRPFLKLHLLALAFTLGGLATAVVFVAVMVLMPLALHFLALDSETEWIVRVVGYALMLVVVLAALDILYRWGPYRAREKWRWVTPGALLAAAGVAVVSVAFSWYAANVSNYNATYGSLGALVGFLTWIWLSVTVVIMGAELNAELEHHRRVQREASAGQSASG